MKPLLHVHDEAEDDLKKIFGHIAADHVDAARRFLDSVWRDFERLAEQPGMGAIREFNNARAAHIRSWPVRGFRNYLIFYRPIENGVKIIRVLHGARDIAAIFEE
jgi:toxin ParE1/3/4